MYTNDNIETLTPEEFAEKYLPVLEQRDAANAKSAQETPENYFTGSRAAAQSASATSPDESCGFQSGAAEACAQAQQLRCYVRNRETGKLELHFDKADYDALTDDQKREIKGAFLWGRKTGCWISRAKEPNLYHAERIARSLGLTDIGSKGERLSFAEQQQRKVERAERRADRFEARSAAAEKRGEALQKPINDMHGDIAFFTQPNINTSAGRAFTRRRDRMFAAFERGFEEYRKSEHYSQRAETARRTANQAELQDKGFIVRRIRECEAAIRKLKKNIDGYDQTKRKIEDGAQIKRFNGDAITLDDVNEWIENDLDKMEAQLDKLGYYQDALDALGGVTFSQENIKPGYIVNVKHFGNCRVVSTGPKNITYQTRVDGIALTASYAEIRSVVRAEEKPAEAQPFKVGEVFTCSRWNREKGDVDRLEFRIIRATDKSVTIQTGDEKPFVRKPTQVAWDKSGKWRLCITDWHDGTVYKLPNQ